MEIKIECNQWIDSNFGQKEESPAAGCSKVSDFNKRIGKDILWKRKQMERKLGTRRE